MSQKKGVHLAHQRTPAEKGQPYLLLGSTSNYTWIYDDSGTGSHRDVTIWRPAPTDAGYLIVGDYAQGYYGAPTGRTLTVKSVNDPNNTLLQPPTQYRQVWNDHGSGGHYDGAIWYPVPPDGFVSLGFVAQGGYDPPRIESYRCVHQSLLMLTSVGPSIWSDSGSGAHGDVTLYSVEGDDGIFVAQANYDPFVGQVYRIKTS